MIIGGILILIASIIFSILGFAVGFGIGYDTSQNDKTDNAK